MSEEFWIGEKVGLERLHEWAREEDLRDEDVFLFFSLWDLGESEPVRGGFYLSTGR